MMEAEPLPRWSHYSALVEKKLYLCGGYTKDFSERSAPSIHSFDPLLEFWAEEKYIGETPPSCMEVLVPLLVTTFMCVVDLMNHVFILHSTSWIQSQEHGSSSQGIQIGGRVDAK
jgi:hypothetical protein